MKTKTTYLKILKPKTRPVQIEPWFFRYLTDGQLKVISAIIAHADYETRQTNSFASNKVIAFYAGFGQINYQSKKYKSLKENEIEDYKKKKLKNGIQTVKNIKKQLENLGVITREIIDGKSYAVVDLEWSKDKYIKEFDESFNVSKDDTQTTDNEIQNELTTLAKLSTAGNISKKALSKRLETLQNKIVPNNKKDIPIEDVDKVVEHIMNTKKIQTKIQTKIITNADNYKQKIKHLIEDGKYNGLNKHYENLLELERYKIKINLNDYITLKHNTYKDNDEEYIFKSCKYNEEYNIYILEYNNKDKSRYIPRTPNLKFMEYLIKNKNYTKTTEKILKDFDEKSKQFLDDHNNKIKEVKNE